MTPEQKKKSLWRNIFKDYVKQIRVPFDMRRKASVAIYNLLEEEGMACCTLEIGPDGNPVVGDLPSNYDEFRCGKIGMKSEMNMWMAGSDYSTGGPSRWCCRSHGVGRPEKEILDAYRREQMAILRGIQKGKK